MEKVLLCVPDAEIVELLELVRAAGAQPLVVERWNIELSLRALEKCDAVVVREPHPEVGFVAGYACARGRTIISFGVDMAKLVKEASYAVDSRDDLTRVLKVLGASGEGSCKCQTFSECTHK